MLYSNRVFNILPRITNHNEDNYASREGGDDALLNSSPHDERADEKVIVNEQRANKTINTPSQTAANTSEENSNDEEILDIDQVEDKDQ